MDETSPLIDLRRRLALGIGENAVFDGWGAAAVDAAADSAGIPRAEARVALPDSAGGLIDVYFDGVDHALAAALPPEQLAAMKVRERIRALVWQRLAIMTPAREAVRQALSILAMPQNAVHAARLGWRAVDRMWRLAGDSSTDFNHYTKRLTLGALYSATLLVWIDDRSDGSSDTAGFLDRRLDDLMRFEKFKAQWRGSSERRPSLARFLGRLRYPPN
jgi:ubiquinone biosynthesis protein COQ9